MKNLMRYSMLAALALVLFAGFGCSKSKSDDLGMEDATMTAEEQAAARRISDGIVYFEFDRFDLKAESKNMLSEKAQILRQYNRLVVTIEGHCDERGTQEYNLALGERRARAAYDYLVNMGVNPNQLQMVSFGKLHPAVEGHGEAAWAKNRRDEFKVHKPRY